MANYIGILDGAGKVWGVRIPDLPGCFGGGATVEAAVADAISAARDWAAHQAAKGVEIASPRPMAQIVADPESGFNPAKEWCIAIPVILDRGRYVKANLSMDAGLLEVIDSEAEKRGVTRSAFMISAAVEKIERGA